MRLMILIPALLLIGCVDGRAEAVTARVAYGDLSLDSREGRAMLRQRVAGAARSYCAVYGAEMTPHASRADPYYCTDMLRSWIIGEMRPEIRRAYFLARHEAGVKGRRL
ncbi:UrcA family protein [Sphingomonas sp. BT-65]|uniref:UrcA family protein n=1 Tax=Sphingomonas sp. BT-65 TaxID=2989821 RepID=UPI002236B45C|nr:UrcA family protein [Sphingomonas sp. BT-65]MCW4463764.1 UrcA family protein [Sphingomonas sp. BT-65]